ncbi:MAG: hypothetical protein IJ614_04405 [Prevotella sp.]|nr:hypothetical protein [Prevotella sp.]MBR1505330.1 hypothetical protein [Prevotella sp.]
MKKFLFAAMAVVMLASCSEDAPFSYRGLALSMPASQFADSMMARGFAIDSAASDSGRIMVFANPAEKYRVLLAMEGEKVQAVQENYKLSTNDSTSMMWQQLRDGLEKELDAWPNCPVLKDNHKIAKFDAETGLITIEMKNTYTPTLSVLYQPKKGE